MPEQKETKLQRSPRPGIVVQRWMRLLRRSRSLPIVLLFGLALIGGMVLTLRKPRLAPMPLPYAFLPSPNCDDRPSAETVSTVVLHSTVEPTTEGTVRLFQSRASEVSAHFVVGKDGQVVQMVRVEKRAWHAGQSELDGVPRVNDFSVGIEMVNLNDGRDPYPEAQMQAVAGIIRFLRSRYAIPDDRLVAHGQVARPPGRKSDPLGFDFDRLHVLIDAPLPTEAR